MESLVQFLARLLPFRCRTCRVWLRRDVWAPQAGQCCVCHTMSRPGTAEWPAEPAEGARPMAKDATPETSPLVREFEDYQGARISITLTFNETTRQITGCTVFRDAACLWRRILVGLGTDGVPDSTPRAFNVPAGTTSVSPKTLSANGIDTVEDFISYQITAGL